MLNYDIQKELRCIHGRMYGTNFGWDRISDFKIITDLIDRAMSKKTMGKRDVT